MHTLDPDGAQSGGNRPKIALDAAQVDHGAFPGDPADRLIYATARDAGVPLITRDAGIREFDPRGTVW